VLKKLQAFIFLVTDYTLHSVVRCVFDSCITYLKLHVIFRSLQTFEPDVI